ncbi:MAG: ABC transporter permease [Brevundimonas sp.]|uniref:ABC transporter permease n=1 Tax=Brevundimonas sp. TaxID=1871086 RepID=UPI00391CB1D8
MVLTDRFRDDLKQAQDAALSSLRTIHALFVRQSRTRYGRRSAGYVWALISPMLLLIVMMAVFSAIARPAGAGESLVVFFLSAILPLYLFRGAINRGGNAIRGNRVLMQYPQVNAFEVITSRLLLEALTYFIVLILFALIMYAFFGLPLTSWIDRPLPMLQAGGALLLLCYGACFLSSQIGRAFDPWNELTGPIGRILLFTSGLWYTMGSLPPELMQYVQYNPLAHVIEWIRDASISDFQSDLYNPWYPLSLGVIFLFLGLFIDWLYRISGYDLQP